MKKLGIFTIGILLLTIVFSSCKECITCEIQGNTVDTVFIDNYFKQYDELCGTSDEVEARKRDVEFAAENRVCGKYFIVTLELDTIDSLILCGNRYWLEDYLDSVLLEANIDTIIKIKEDTFFYNPASFDCSYGN
ncbi:MAG: hypothetical protein HN704_03715 [Bacteroidetes bacterium]|jgi:hypothetical protein|nr:hypothetical protein [Bacteroidota bacterium]MBT6687743.1 hypothetical protein [Bacteroidota bacterium]MBT7143377.1 hypothetical protein [Bacteroidota bacterium]MBT7490699.1 hypothetical protein [Bacteroidota bacterium]